MIAGMPSRQATKAALRRSYKPRLILSAGPTETPSLGQLIFNDRVWRNSVQGYD